MSEIVDAYVARLQPRAEGVIKGTARLEITAQGSVMLDERGARAGNEAADVVLMASDRVFRDILSGKQNPVMAFMSGALKVEGNTRRALKISAILTA